MANEITSTARPTNPRFRNLTGKTFGSWQVEAYLGTNVNCVVIYQCVCACGRRQSITGSNLRQGQSRQCRPCSAKTHGGYGSPEYRAWQAIKSRCIDTKNKRYGGRGIKVCARWRRSFAAFLADMGRRPSSRHSIDRKNNDGHYTPSNCRWATLRQQARNTRRTARVKIGRVTRLIVEWAEISGTKRTTIIMRLKAGWPPREAVFGRAKAA